MENGLTHVFQLVMTWQLWMVAIACGIACSAFKQLSGNSKLVPLFNLVFGVVAMCAIMAQDIMAAPKQAAYYVLAGIIASSVATYAYELFNNLLKATGKKNTEVAETIEDFIFPEEDENVEVPVVAEVPENQGAGEGIQTKFNSVQ